MRRRAFLALSFLLCAAALALLAGGARSADADRILSAHPVHAQNDLGCETCHAAAAGSTAGSDNLLPDMETCSACHDVTDAATCGTCHTNPEAPGAAPRRVSVAQRFPHATHLGDGADCGACHGPATAAPVMPEKVLCRSCHETASGGSDCLVCHAEGEPLIPATHAPGWTSFHADDARVDQDRCGGCHTQTDCQECHSGDNVRPRSHPLNYAYSHALDARGQELNCSGCHEDVQFCQGCHASEQVLPEGHSRADWTLTTGGGRHAEEAELDLESCAVCHDQGGSPVCARCHGR